MIKSDKEAGADGLALKLDPVEKIVPVALPLSENVSPANEFFAMLMLNLSLSADSDGIGYWGEAVIFGWLLLQKYGSKFKTPMIENISPGHCVLKGKRLSKYSLSKDF